MLIDAHTHVVPGDFPANPVAAEGNRWPRIGCGECGHRTMFVGDRPFRTVQSNAWNPEARLADMDFVGVAAQILSPMPELLSYWLQPEQTAVLARHTNATIGAMVASCPKRFFGFGTVTLQDPDRAAREAMTLRSEFGLIGIEVGSHINGVPIGDPRFHALFHALVEADLALFVHALHPSKDRLTGPALMEALVAFPPEGALAMVSMMVHGVLDKFPTLRVALSHGGGTFPWILGRLQQGWTLAADVRAAIRRAPIDYARQVFYDTLLYDTSALRFLVATVGAERLLVGTDYPFLIQEADPVGYLHRSGLDEATLKGIAAENCRRFLNI